MNTEKNFTENKYEIYSEVFKALGHSTRLKIVVGLVGCCCNVTNIVNQLGIPQTTVSQHLRILKNAGIVKGEKKGLEVCYRVVDENVEAFIKVLKLKCESES